MIFNVSKQFRLNFHRKIVGIDLGTTNSIMAALFKVVRRQSFQILRGLEQPLLWLLTQSKRE